ncbi:MAG TPA: hypothetical protein VL242_51170 [Sorangium sp.]|uniref:hypothetical protein n=1 Tax=Sorangium sp. So ce1153 TaxID=3133333 RepID=UPI002C69C575|nr:hypothetical protein [Sorangium sp.]
MMRSPHRLSMAAGSLALLVQAACGAAVVVDGGGGGAGGAGGASEPGSTTTWADPSVSTSVGPTPTTPGDPATTTSGGPTPGPSAIVYGDSTVTIRVSTLPLTCRDPGMNPTFEPCGVWWDLELRMPESMLVVGEVDMASGDLSFFEMSSRADCSTTGAASGGGDTGFGRLTITAVEPTSVTFELSAVGPLLPDSDPNGRYVAARCAEP